MKISRTNLEKIIKEELKSLSERQPEDWRERGPRYHSGQTGPSRRGVGDPLGGEWRSGLPPMGKRTLEPRQTEPGWVDPEIRDIARDAADSVDQVVKDASSALRSFDDLYLGQERKATTQKKKARILEQLEHLRSVKAVLQVVGHVTDILLHENFAKMGRKDRKEFEARVSAAVNSIRSI